MHRSLLSVAVLLSFILTPRPYPIPPTNPNPVYNLYFPLAFKSYPFVDFVEIGVVNKSGYPGEVCLYGYLASNMPTAVYSVTMAIDVKIYGYCYPNCTPVEEEDQPGHLTHYGEPMLDASLPDQKNPFYYCLYYTKGYYEYDKVKLLSASLNPPNGRITYPLTVKSWTKRGAELETTISGIVRNDSGHSLTEIRVVGIAGACKPKEAELRSTRLDPGKETSFFFNQFYCQTYPPGYTVGDMSYGEMVEISAQGVAEP